MVVDSNSYKLLINGTITTPFYEFDHPTRKNQMNSCLVLKNGAIAYSDKILKVGKLSEVFKEYKKSNADKIIDAKGNLVLPGFVDSHTHVSFVGSREKELEWKIDGLSYTDIADRGGGILSSTQRTREAPLEEIINENRSYLDRMLLTGTTTIEAKSGYGLNTVTELKQLQAIHDLNNLHPIDIHPTFLGAHAIPSDSNAEDYSQLILDEMLPAVKKQNIAKFIDVFCEKGYFSVDQTRKIIEKGIELNLRPKIHVDEIAENFGGSELAAELNCLSADHLLQISEKGMGDLAKKSIVGSLLPGTPFVLRMKEYPPAKRMMEKGVPLAISTDFNPNCMLTSMLTVMTLSSYQMAMKPMETLTAATINGAWAIDQAKNIGSLAPGKQADIVILDVPNIHFIAYYLGQNTVRYVIKNGKTVVKNKTIEY
ncbi:MAG: imidazolonepropionase [Candidatus Hodarchaeales archaeon]|jgi:imidazolonepropionase